MKKWDVLIIGSGISALTAAVLLAQAGKSVCILEQHTKPGGFLHCFNRFGLKFETGAHYIGAMNKGEPFRVLMEYLGVYDESLFIPLAADGFDEFTFPDFKFQFAPTYPETIQRLIAHFPVEATAIQKYFSTLEALAASFPTYLFHEKYDPLEIQSSLKMPLATFVESLTQNTRLKNVFYSYCCLYGVAPQDIALGLHALVTDSLMRGGVGFAQGGDGLALKFVSRIQKLGGKVKTGYPVSKLLIQDKNISEVITESGESFFASQVISSIHPKATFRMMDEKEFSPAFLSRIHNLKESSAFFGIYAQCKIPPPFDPQKNYYFYHAPVGQTFEHPSTLDPQFLFVCRSDRDGKGHNGRYPLTIHGMAPIEWFDKWKDKTKGNEDYKALKQELAARVLASLKKSYPQIESIIENMDISTPLTTLHFNGSENGSSYGIYHSIGQTGERALGPRTHIQNLFLTGQNTLMPGIMGSAISGLRTAGHILGIKPILRELRQRREMDPSP